MGKSKSGKTGGGVGTNGFEVKGSAKTQQAAAATQASSVRAAASTLPASPLPSNDNWHWGVERIEDWFIKGVTEITFQAAPGEPVVAGGSCDYCGTGIRYAVVIEHKTDGRTRKVGRDCGQRVGLNPEEIKELNRQLFAEKRQAASRARSAAYRKENGTEAEDVPQALLGRLRDRYTYWQRQAAYGAGKPAEEVTLDDMLRSLNRDIPVSMLAAVEDLAGTNGFVWNDDLDEAERQLDEWVPAPFKPELVKPITALFDSQTGELLTTNLRDTQFGLAWYSDEIGFVNPSAARKPETRRKNNAKKGVYVGVILAEAVSGDSGDWVPKDANYQVARIVSVLDNGQFPELYFDWDADYEKALELAEQAQR